MNCADVPLTCATPCDLDNGYCNIDTCACNNGYTLGTGVQCNGKAGRRKYLARQSRVKYRINIDLLRNIFYSSGMFEYIGDIAHFSFCFQLFPYC